MKNYKINNSYKNYDYSLNEDENSWIIKFNKELPILNIKKCKEWESWRKSENQNVFYSLYNNYRQCFKDYLQQNVLDINFGHIVFRELMEKIYIIMEWDRPDLLVFLPIYGSGYNLDPKLGYKLNNRV